MAGIHVLIPAAGAARRMRGADKLLEEIEGTAQLRRAVQAARKSGAAKVWVSLRPDDAARRATLKGSWAKVLVVEDWEDGLSASLRAGARAAAAQKAEGLAVLLADLPEIGSEDLALLLAARAADPDAVWRATAEDGTPGHPVLFPPRLFEELAHLSGDAGARPLLKREQVRHVALPGQRAVTDLDTPEAWAEWRARTGR